MTARFFVITGGPGAGKSAIVAGLAARGVAVSEEVGRSIIRDEVASGGTALPWSDKAAFADRMLAAEITAYRVAESRDCCVVFDRGVPDVLGYRRLVGLSVPSHVEATAHRYRYNRLVFAAPPWREIFTGDAERKQSFAEAEATYAIMVSTYGALGYELMTLPRSPVEARVAIVLETIERAKGGDRCI